MPNEIILKLVPCEREHEGQMMPALSVCAEIKGGAELGEMAVLFRPDSPNPLLSLMQPTGLSAVLGILLMFAPTRQIIFELGRYETAEVRWTLYQEDI